MNIDKLFGPPGTGKTSALLARMEAELARGTPPDRIAFLTFTVAARREAVARACDKFGYTPDQLPFFRTLHSIAYRALGMTSATMVKSAEDLREFGELAGVTFSQSGARGDFDSPFGHGFAGGEDGDKLLAFDHFRRHNLLTPEQAYRSWTESEVNLFQVRRFCNAYRDWKEQEGLMDFTDLLAQPIAPLPVDVVFVDEAQDLSRLQWQALDRFAAAASRMVIAGDDDQAIFAWAGASPEEFVRRPGRVEVLGQSYRLPRRVHALARSIIERIQQRQAKEWASRDEDGEVRVVQDPDMEQFDREGTYLVLYRNHYLSKEVEQHVRDLGLPYARHDKPAPGAEYAPAIVYWERLRKGKRLGRRELEVVLGAMRNGRQVLRQLPEQDDYGLESIPARDAPWFEALDRIAASDSQYLRAILRHHGTKGLLEPPRIRLSTIHAAKGAEADHVVLLTDASWRVKRAIQTDPDPERRVFYVGVTRAKRTLTLVGVHNPLFM